MPKGNYFVIEVIVLEWPSALPSCKILLQDCFHGYSDVTESERVILLTSNQTFSVLLLITDATVLSGSKNSWTLFQAFMGTSFFLGSIVKLSRYSQEEHCPNLENTPSPTRKYGAPLKLMKHFHEMYYASFYQIIIYIFSTHFLPEWALSCLVVWMWFWVPVWCNWDRLYSGLVGLPTYSSILHNVLWLCFVCLFVCFLFFFNYGNKLYLIWFRFRFWFDKKQKVHLFKNPDRSFELKQNPFSVMYI